MEPLILFRDIAVMSLLEDVKKGGMVPSFESGAATSDSSHRLSLVDINGPFRDVSVGPANQSIGSRPRETGYICSKPPRRICHRVELDG